MLRGKMKKNKNRTKWNSIFLFNGLIMFIKTSTGKMEIPFSFISAVS